MNTYEINEMLESDFYDDTDNDPDYEADSESDDIEENGNVLYYSVIYYVKYLLIYYR